MNKEYIVNDRIPLFDALKGTAILLMIINHVSLDGGILIGKFIGVFHMPLFFIVSGYLYKRRELKETTKRNTTKILLPYLLTCIVIWLIMWLAKGDLGWGWSILWGNSRPFNSITGVGPLWFLTAFFWTMIYANMVLRIPSKFYRWILITVLFATSVVLVQKTEFLLPFGITTGLGGTIFLMVGMEVKENPVYIRKPIFVWIGVCVWLLCVVFGYCAMAWHIYKLNILQVISGFYGTYICYLVINQLRDNSFIWKILCFVGSNSLSLLCVHSIDRVLNLTSQLTTFLLGSTRNDITHWLLEIALKFLFVMTVFVIIRQIPVLRKVFQINN